MKIFILFFAIMGNLNAQIHRKKAEYLITTNQSGSESEIATVIREKAEIKPIGSNRYLIKFEEDPGLDKLNRLMKSKKWLIQPNLKSHKF